MSSRARTSLLAAGREVERPRSPQSSGNSSRTRSASSSSRIQPRFNRRSENLVRFEARREQNGLPAVAIRDLLKAALRHRPDRIILGEIRGGEAFDLLQLLNTGHSGTLSTIHANSAKQGLARFTSCVLQSGIELPYRAIKTNIADSLNVIVQIERRPGRRYISEVLLINGYDPDADLFDYGAVFLTKRDTTMNTNKVFTPKSLTASEYVLALFEPE